MDSGVNPFLRFMVILAIACIAAACRPNQLPQPVNTPPSPTPSRTAILPTDTPSPFPISKTQATLPALPAPTANPATPTLEVRQRCFATADSNLLAFTPDGKNVLLRAATAVEIISLETLQQETMIQAPRNILTAALSPDGQTLAWGLEDNTIQLIRISDSKIIATLSGHTDLVTKLKFSLTGDRLYSASHDTWVRVWDRNGKQITAFQPTGADNLPSQVLGMGISPDGTQLATVPFDGPVKVWSLPDLKPAFELGGSGGFDTSDVAFSPDGRFIASDLATGLSLWRLSDRTQLLSGINSMAFAFSPDSRLLAYADIANDNKIVLFYLDNLQQASSLGGPALPTWELVFSPDGALLAAAGVEINIWRLADGKLVSAGKAACP